MLDVAVELAREAGVSLMETLGGSHVIERKGDRSNIVTAADTRSERIIVHGIHMSFPGHSIIAEETGCDVRASEYTWVVDPLDGTSNYAAAIPWFGVLICVLRGGIPIAAVMHMPASGDMYTAEAGAGAYRNDQRISVTQEASLSNALWAYGMDGGTDDQEAERHVSLLAHLVRRVRNVRATNSLVDAALTADGRLGGLLNWSTRLWDIAAPMLVVQEAGGMYTDVRGGALRLDLSLSACDREYAVLAGAPALHREVAGLVRTVSGTLWPRERQP
jgi:myo-inositol-1(or 4)-monophosphatase